MRTVRLLRRHRHGSRELEPGAQLAVAERTAAWLVEQRIADPVDWAPERAALLTPADEMRKASTKAPAKTSAARSGCCGPRWGSR